MVVVLLAGCGRALPDDWNPPAQPAFSSSTVGSPVGSETIPTTPVQPKVYYGDIGQTIAIDSYSIEVTSISFSTCDDSAPEGKSFLFVNFIVGIDPGADTPSIGALEWTLSDAHDDSIGANWFTPACGIASDAPNHFTVAFVVSDDVSGLAATWDPGDFTGHQAVIDLGR